MAVRLNTHLEAATNTRQTPVNNNPSQGDVPFFGFQPTQRKHHASDQADGGCSDDDTTEDTDDDGGEDDSDEAEENQIHIS